MKEKEIEKTLLKLLKQYHHYRFVSGGIFTIFLGWFAGMSLGGFMEWLKSRED